MIIRLLIFTLTILPSLTSFGQSKSSRTIMGEESAKVQLEEVLNEKTRNNVIDNAREIVSDSTMAIDIAEAILFKSFGQENIKRQRPYEIYKIKNYWSISGTLERGAEGGGHF